MELLDIDKWIPTLDGDMKYFGMNLKFKHSTQHVYKLFGHTGYVKLILCF